MSIIQNQETQKEVKTILDIEDPHSLSITANFDTSHARLVMPIRSKQYYSYITLDSANCHSINDARDKFTWLIREENAVVQPGIINLYNKPRNIVAARLGLMSMDNMPKQFADDAANFHRYGIGFDEFVSQAFLIPNGYKFQFISALKYLTHVCGTNAPLNPFTFNNGWFRFREPYAMLHTLTLNIMNLTTKVRVSLPDSYVSFDAIKHSGNAVVIAYPSATYNNTITISDGRFMPIHYIYVYNYQDDLNKYPVINQVRFSNISTGDSDLDALYNGQLKNISIIKPAEFIVDGEVGQIFPTGDYTMTISFIYKPSFIGTMELISEYDNIN